MKENTKKEILTSLKVLYEAKKIPKGCGIKEAFNSIPSIKNS